MSYIENNLSLKKYFHTMLHISNLMHEVDRNKMLVEYKMEGKLRLGAVIKHIGAVKFDYVNNNHVCVTVFKDDISYSMEIVNIIIEDNMMTIVEAVMKYGQQRDLQDICVFF